MPESDGEVNGRNIPISASDSHVLVCTENDPNVHVQQDVGKDFQEEMSTSVDNIFPAHESSCLETDYLEVLVNELAVKIREEFSNCSQLNLNHFLCTLCRELVTDPVTLKCGHTFSKKCVLAAAKKFSSFECQKCSRSYCYSYLSTLKINVKVSSITENLFNISSESKRNSTAPTKYDKSDITDFFRTRWKKLVGEMDVNSSLIRNPCPMNYLKGGDYLVSSRKYDDAVISYLICFILDPTAIDAKNKAIKILQDFLPNFKENCHFKKSNDPILSFRSITKCPFMQRNDTIPAKKCNNVASDNEHRLYIQNDIKQTVDGIIGDEVHFVLKKFWKSVTSAIGQNFIKDRLDSICLDKKDLECPLCMRVLWEPVTTPCGHVFCRVCLYRCFDHQPICPLCKASLSNLLAERIQSVTEFLEAAIKTLIPDEYLERQSIHREEITETCSGDKDSENIIPLFICTIAYPSVPCPLHIFEPRYRLMLRRCMESGSRKFGMCTVINEKISEFGTVVEIQDVQYFSDGRSVVDTTGIKRFRIINLGMRDGYHIATIQYLEDTIQLSINVQDTSEIHAHVYKISQAWFFGLPRDIKHQILRHFGSLPQVEENYSSLPNGPSWFWWMVAVLPIDAGTQVTILSMTSLHHRLKILYRILLHFHSPLGQF